MNLQPYFEFISSLAYRAGRITLGYYNTGIRHDFKPDDSPVTAADRATEEFIRAEIERAYPTHAIVGEEYGESAGQGNPFRWIVDPIDGTKTFLRGVPFYGVLIGLEIEGVVRAGAAYYPALDEMLIAADGLGCWWNGRPARVSQVSQISQAVACYTDARNIDAYQRGEAWDRIQRACWFARGWGDCYAYLLVATGRAEIAVDPVLNVWDCGPFPVIFREAGGYFGSWEGEEGHLHGEALACNAALKPRVMELVRGL